MDLQTNVNMAQSQLLVEKWQDNITLIESAKESKFTPEAKGTMAQLLENTSSTFQLLESTDAGATNGVKQFAIDLVSVVVPNLVAESLVSVQAMSNQVGMVNYIKYIYTNNKGQVKAGQTFASALMETNSDMYYSSQEIDAEALELTGTKLEGSLSWLPVLPKTLKVEAAATVGGQLINVHVIDDGNGGLTTVDAFSGATVAGIGTGTINYATGALEFNFDAGATLSTTEFTANYHYDQKSVGAGAIGDNVLQVPEVEIKLATIPIMAQSRKLKALYAFDAMFTLQKEYGADINQLLNAQVAAEIVHEIDGEIMFDLLRGAGLLNEAWSETVPYGVNKRDHFESFYNTLIKGSNKIYGATQRAQGTFLIVGLDVSSVVETMPQFKPAAITPGNVGPHVVGTLGQFTVVKNAYFPARQYVIGYKGTTTFEAGYIYAPYLPVTSTQLVMLDDFVGRKGWATSYGKKMVNPRLYCRGEITA